MITLWKGNAVVTVAAHRVRRESGRYHRNCRYCSFVVITETEERLAKVTAALLLADSAERGRLRFYGHESNH